MNACFSKMCREEDDWWITTVISAVDAVYRDENGIVWIAVDANPILSACRARNSVVVKCNSRGYS